MERDLDKFNESTWPPMTQAKQDLIDINMDSRERFYREWVKDEINGLPFMPCVTDDLYEGYRTWTIRSGIARSSPMHTFSAYISKQPGVVKTRERILGGIGIVKKMMIVPSHLQPPEDGTRQTWLSQSADEFSEKLHDFKGGKA